jgi:hypothetical protein
MPNNLHANCSPALALSETDNAGFQTSQVICKGEGVPENIQEKSFSSLKEKKTSNVLFLYK